MMTTYHTFRSRVIQSVRVHSTPKPSIFVITQDPALINVVRELFEQTEAKEVSVVWLTSVESACRRLEWNAGSMIVVDADSGSEDSLDRLHLEAPEARVVVLTGATASKPAR